MLTVKKGKPWGHYSKKNTKLDVIKGQARVDKVATLLRSLISPQKVLPKPQADQDSVSQTRFVVSELIAKKLKPYAEGEFMECFTVELLTPKKNLENQLRVASSSLPPLTKEKQFQPSH